MGCRMKPTGFVSMVVVVVMMLLTIAPAGGVLGSMSSNSRLVKSSSESGDSIPRSSSTWRKLLARRRHPAAVGFRTEPVADAAADEEQVQGKAGHFVAAFSFFSSMAKGSASPSPATPSPGHN